MGRASTERTAPAGQLPARPRARLPRERSQLAGHETGQDHLALYLHNGNEYLEAMLGALQGAGRAVQRQLPLRRRGAALPAARRRRHGDRRATRRSRRRSPRCCPTLPGLRVHAPGGRRLRQRPAARRRLVRGRAGRGVARPAAGRAAAPTTSTSSTPAARRHAQGRAVAPRRHHGRVLRRLADGDRRSTSVARRGRDRRLRALLAPPFMHGAGHWMSLQHVDRRRHRRASSRRPSGSTRPTSGAPSSARRSNFLLIVGDAFARPLLDELERAGRTTSSSLTVMLSGGAPLSAPA